MTLRGLARLAGYGSNHIRIRKLFYAKKNATTVIDLVNDDAVQAKFKERKDKLSGDPIWMQAWHHFMAEKKGQSQRCQIIKTERVKDPTTKTWLWKTQWARHQKRFMSIKIEEFHASVLKWEPYLQWRRTYLSKNPRLGPDWQVGISRLYKEKCFCIDPEEQVRKCGCEYHLKMDQLVVALKKFRRDVRTAVKKTHPDHTCEVYLIYNNLIFPTTQILLFYRLI